MALPVVFAHGLGQRTDAWQQVITQLPADTRAQSPQLFTDSAAAGNSTFDNLYQDFAVYCDSIYGQINLCGLSLGGLLALKYTLQHPEKVQALVLIGTPSKIPKTLFRVQSLVFRLLPNRIFQQMGLPKRQVLELTKSMTNLDFEEQLPQISCPVLVVCGSKDTANKKSAESLAAKIPNATLNWIPNTGHEVNATAPELLGTALTEFLARNDEVH